MQSVGEQLREARLEKNLSLDEVYRQTKIHTRVLESLEQDRADNFLSPIYIKGFLKSYAQYLGLDSERLIKEYRDSQKTEAAPQAEPPLPEKKKVIPQFNPFLVLRVSLACILAAALLFYFNYMRKHIASLKEKESSPIEAPAVKIKVTPASTNIAQSQELKLEVRSKDNCWIKVSADGKVVFEQILAKGKKERWQAKESINLRIGKPEALEVFVNGKAVDLEKAQVKKTLMITREQIKGN